MVIFRCLQSGNTVAFKHQVDIDSMKGHSGYARVDGPTDELEVKPLPMVAPPITRMGRPRKSAPTF